MPDEVGSDSALVLDEHEWTDLGEIAQSYLGATEWADTKYEARHGREPGVHIDTIQRRRALCQRILDANNPGEVST